MTAEVAILNAEAVALAADSAVTATNHHGRKIFNTATKLFPLSVKQPIAVMFYGSVLFGRLPWEAVIKAYRRHTERRNHQTIRDASEDFVQYLNTLQGSVTDEDRAATARALLRWEVRRLAMGIAEERLSRQRNGKRFTVRSESSTLNKLLVRRKTELQQLPICDDMSPTEARSMVRSMVRDWQPIEHEIFGNTGGRLDSAQRQSTKEMLQRSLMCTIQWPGSTGIVLSGFGTSQLFPALSHFRVEPALGAGVRVNSVEAIDLEADSRARIVPLAQTEMMNSYLRGWHPALYGMLGQSLDRMNGRSGDHILSRVKDDLPSATFRALKRDVQAMQAKLSESLRYELVQEMEWMHTQPIMSIVNMLPKEELAEMAEALVNLTSLQRRISPQEESVGGPVDVAVVSRGDGLVWIKRKHYFPKELNFRYFEQNKLQY